VNDPARYPSILQTVLDCPDARGLAEFYRQLYGLYYRPGDEPSTGGGGGDGGDRGAGRDWLVLLRPDGARVLAFQQVPAYQAPTWPVGPRPQMLHLDSTVPTVADLFRQRQRALALGARELFDRSDDPDEPLFVFADPAGHPFCLFVED
jgi:catechol 2,3-dioxygenase-like lactoylglutathione lyase family enzyme